MFCSKCGNQVAENSMFCPVCGNKMGGGFADTPEAVSAGKPKNNGTGLKIGIAVTAVIAVMAIALAVLFATGTLSFNKDKGNNISVSEENTPDNITPQKNEETKAEEPIVGEIYDLPVVTGDKSVKKIMLKVNSNMGGDNNETGKKTTNIVGIGVDYSNPDKPLIYAEQIFTVKIEGQSNVRSIACMMPDGEMYMRYLNLNSEEAKDTYKMQMETDESDMRAFNLYNIYFGRYELCEDFLKDENIKFKYLGKDELVTGAAYIYEFTVTDNSGENKANKIWVDADTGYMVKNNINGETSMEVTEIITGDSVEFPELDFANAIELE